MLLKIVSYAYDNRSYVQRNDIALLSRGKTEESLDKITSLSVCTGVFYTCVREWVFSEEQTAENKT